MSATQDDKAAREREQRAGATPKEATLDDVMKIRKQAGSVAEVIEPVQRTRMERTDR